MTKVIQITKPKDIVLVVEMFLQNNIRINVTLNVKFKIVKLLKLLNVKINNLNGLIYVLIEYISGIVEFHQG